MPGQRRYFELLLRAGLVNVTVFGATGVVGRALVPMLASTS